MGYKDIKRKTTMFYQEKNITIHEETSGFELAAFATIGDRTEQQDCFGFHMEDENGMFVLCDGMGGHEGGAAASRAAARHFLDSYEKSAESGTEENEIDFLNRIIKESNTIVRALPSETENAPKGGTTAVSVIINSRKLYWCSAGDSRAYLFRNGEFVQFTLDQNYRTVLDENIRAGVIDEAEYNRESAMAESLISYIGIRELSLIDYNDAPLELMSEDRIIIMSDGLYKNVSDDELKELLTNFINISDAVSVLETKASKNARKKNTKRDNTTFIIIKIK